MRITLLLFVLAFSSLANARSVLLKCQVHENRSLILEKSVEIRQRETTLADLGQFLIQIQTADGHDFSLSVLDRHEEIRMYTEARLINNDDRVALALWKRSGLLEVECRRTQRIRY